METFRLLIGPDNGDATVMQVCARAILLFVFGILCIRVAGRRTFSQYSPLDIVVAIVAGSNISRMMTGKAPFVPGLAATFLLVVIHRVVAMASLRWRILGWLAKSQPVVLVRDGIVIDDALVAHQLSRDDLLEGLRMEQVDDPRTVKLAVLEAGGKISVVRKSD